MNNKVSIIIPVYNVESYIKSCIGSVLNQTYNNIEVIIVDDKCKDNSISIARTILENQNRISFKILDHKINKGVSAARNTGLLEATGDYIFFLDSDDLLMSACIEKLVDKANETNAEIIMCLHHSDENNNYGGKLHSSNEVLTNNAECIKSFAMSRFNVAPWCKLIKKDFLLNNGIFFKEGIINEDAPWSFQLCLNAQRIAFLQEDLYYYRYNSNSIMSNSKKKYIIQSNEIALCIFFNEIMKRPEIWTNVDIYTIFMRQIIIFYTLVYKLCDIKSFFKKIKFLKTYKYNSPYFNSNDQIPLYYRLWNKAYHLPIMLASIYCYIIILLQDIKSK